MTTEEMLSEAIREAILITLESLGIKPKDVRLYISQSEAFRLAGRKRVEAAMRKGEVKFSKRDPDRRNSKVSVLRSDVIKLLKQP